MVSAALVGASVRVGLNPRVIVSLLGGGAFLRIVGEQLGDEVFRGLGNGFEDLGFKVELT